MKTVTTTTTTTTIEANDGSDQSSSVSVTLNFTFKTQVNKEQAVAAVTAAVKAANELGLILEDERGEAVEILGYSDVGEWEAGGPAAQFTD